MGIILNFISGTEGVFKLIALEISFWGVVFGFIVIFAKLIKESKRNELIIFVSIILLGVILRLKYGIFAPLHERIQYIEIINNYYQNFLNHNFFEIQYYYSSTFGFMDYFMNKILYLFSSFNVYYVYSINLIISVASGIVLYFISRTYLKSTIIAQLAILIYMLFPIDIRYSATEIQTIITCFTILLYIAIFLLFIKKPSVKYLVLLVAVALANLYGRIDFAAIFWVITVTSFAFLLYRLSPDKTWKYILAAFIILVAISFLGNSSFYLEEVYSDRYMIRAKDNWEYRVNFFPDLLFIQNFFGDHHPGHPSAYLKSYFIPLYFLLALKFSWLLAFSRSRRKEYISILILTLFFVFTVGYLANKANKTIRLALPVFPFLSILVACVIYKIINIQKFNRKYLTAISFAIILFFFIQNISFLNLTLARQEEQTFILKNLSLIPENSLLITLSDKRFADSSKDAPDFEPVEPCSYNRKSEWKYIEGREFPRYLLPKKSIDIMDICLDLNPKYFDNYENIYYYRGLYSYYGIKNPGLTKKFEEASTFWEVDSRTIINNDINSNSVRELKAGNSNSVADTNKLVTLGLYKLK